MPAPSNIARLNSTMGVARSVDRSAKPAVVLVMNVLMKPPTVDGDA